MPRTRTSSVSSDPSRTFSSSQASHLAWMGESNLKLGTVETRGGRSEMEDAGGQRGLNKAKEMYKMVKFIKLKL